MDEFELESSDGFLDTASAGDRILEAGLNQGYDAVNDLFDADVDDDYVDSRLPEETRQAALDLANDPDIGNLDDEADDPAMSDDEALESAQQNSRRHRTRSHTLG